mmetsp:Transcript_7133/g.30405  ORF Transcript_7133/g.30405 Transcript_7133/m.30405 type:complete len:255 (-) Transcript_7133:397-1161(-)
MNSGVCGCDCSEVDEEELSAAAAFLALSFLFHSGVPAPAGGGANIATAPAGGARFACAGASAGASVPSFLEPSSAGVAEAGGAAASAGAVASAAGAVDLVSMRPLAVLRKVLLRAMGLTPMGMPIMPMPIPLPVRLIFSRARFLRSSSSSASAWCCASCSLYFSAGIGSSEILLFGSLLPSAAVAPEGKMRWERRFSFICAMRLRSRSVRVERLLRTGGRAERSLASSTFAGSADSSSAASGSGCLATRCFMAR